MKKLLVIIIAIGFWQPSNCQSEILSDELKLNLDLTLYSGQSLDSLLKDITKNVTDSELTKVYAVAYWIAKHIRYDNEGLRNGFWHRIKFDTRLAKITLDKGKTICGGYAMLGNVMFNKINVRNEIVTGTAKGRNYNDSNTNENHAWNVVRIDSIWHLFDLTWASPKQENGSVNEFYLDSKPERLMSTHYPENQNWSLVSNTYSKEEFKNMPRISALFFEFGLAKSIPKIEIDSNKISIELSNDFDGDIGFILHEKGTYNSDIVEHIEIVKDKIRIAQIPVPNDNKKYKVEMTYISRKPMLKHFELLTIEVGTPADNKR